MTIDLIVPGESIWGMHAANGVIDDVNFLRMAQLGVSHTTWLHGEADYIWRWHRLSTGVRGITLVRFYHSKGWRELDPEWWADVCAHEYTRERIAPDGSAWSLRSESCHVTPSNEQNLPEEGGDDSLDCYRYTAEWNRRWARRFRALTGVPIYFLHWPAWAYGHRDDWDPPEEPRGYVGIEVCREVIELDYYWFDGHPYPHARTPTVEHPEWGLYNRFDGARFLIWHDLLPKKPMFFSETNVWNVREPDAPDILVDWLRFVGQFTYVRGATLFIWMDPTSHHANNKIESDGPIARRLAAESKPPTLFVDPSVTPGGHGMDTAELARNESDLYRRFGVPLNPSGAIFRYWHDKLVGGRFFGPPMEQEHPTEDGRYIVQAFANEVLTYDRQTGQVTEGYPLA